MANKRELSEVQISSENTPVMQKIQPFLQFNAEHNRRGRLVWSGSQDVKVTMM